MKRTTKRAVLLEQGNPQQYERPDLIIGSDFHLREDTPVCRTDDFEAVQWSKLIKINQLQEAFQCPVIHAGDLFEHWKPSPSLLSKVIKYLPKDFNTIYGNHDTPQHSLELIEKSGVYTLKTAGVLKVFFSGHFGTDIDGYTTMILPYSGGERKILVWHVFNYKGKEPWPGCTAPSASRLLKKYPEYDLIVTGDNHQTFIEEDYDGRLLINPGSLTRQKADQINHKPCVWFYYAEENKAIPYYFNVDSSVISREHLEVVKERDERIATFVDKLKTDWKVEMSFEENLERFFEVNEIRPSVVQIIKKALDNEEN